MAALNAGGGAQLATERQSVESIGNARVSLPALLFFYKALALAHDLRHYVVSAYRLCKISACEIAHSRAYAGKIMLHLKADHF